MFRDGPRGGWDRIAVVWPRLRIGDRVCALVHGGGYATGDCSIRFLLEARR